MVHATDGDVCSPASCPLSHRDMFHGASSFNSGLSSWDVARVTDMLCVLCGGGWWWLDPDERGVDEGVEAVAHEPFPQTTAQ